MTITVELPDDIASHEHAGREALESLVIQGYRTEQMSPKEARLLLGMDRLGFQAFVAERGEAQPGYGVEELLEDIETGNRLRQSGLIPA